MKRDARIGLAVVLVLGLAVTLLIGRALVKRGGEVADADAETGSGGPAAYSAEAAHVNGAPAANIASPSPAPTILDEPAARPAEANPAVKQFIDDQTRRLGVENAAPAPVPAPAPSTNKAPTVEAPAGGTRPLNGATPPEPPKVDHSALLDHEQSGPASPHDAQAPADGYGYVIAAGDNMWKISAKVFGDGKYTQKIIDANPHLNAAKMKVGSVIKIPAIPNKTVLMKLPSFAEASKAPAGGAAIAAKKEESKKAEPVAASTHAKAPEEKPAADGPIEATTHKIEAGETLGSIAHKYYGVSGPKTIAKIVAANKGLDPARLKVGQELQIPAKK